MSIWMWFVVPFIRSSLQLCFVSNSYMWLYMIRRLSMGIVWSLSCVLITMWNNALTWLIEFFLQFNGWFWVVQVLVGVFCVFLQSLRLSNGNEQNLCNLAHWFFIFRLSPPSRKRQGGVNRVPQALQACILTITRGRVERSHLGDNPIIFTASSHSLRFAPLCQTRFSPCKVSDLAHACPVAPRRDPTTEWCFPRCIMLKISRVGSRLAATYQAIVFRFAKSPT